MTSYGCELWRSDDNREIHTFRRDGSEAGYTYIIGFDPDVIDPSKIINFLHEIGLPEAAVAIAGRITRA